MRVFILTVLTVLYVTVSWGVHSCNSTPRFIMGKFMLPYSVKKWAFCYTPTGSVIFVNIITLMECEEECNMILPVTHLEVCN